MPAGEALGTRSGTCLVGVPRLLAVVAEIHATSRSLTVKLWTSGTATCYHRIPINQAHHGVVDNKTFSSKKHKKRNIGFTSHSFHHSIFLLDFLMNF